MNALRESSLFWQLSCSFRSIVFILCIIFFRPLLPFFFRKIIHPYLRKKFCLTICESFFRLWASWFSWLTRWSFFSVTVDCRELAWSRNISIKRLSHGWWTQIKEIFSSAFISWYVDVSPSRVWKSPQKKLRNYATDRNWYI